MNPKALADKFMKAERSNGFLSAKILMMKTVQSLYRSYIKSPLWDMPMFVILDNSIYSVIRLVLGPEKVTAQEYGGHYCIDQS